MTITFLGGYQEYYQFIAEDEYDMFTYDAAGNLEYYGNSGDEWFYDADNAVWEYYSSETNTWFGSDNYNGWLTDNYGNFIQYDRKNNQYIFTSVGDNQYYYYPGWSWGNKESEWYLKGDKDSFLDE